MFVENPVRKIVFVVTNLVLTAGWKLNRQDEGNPNSSHTFKRKIYLKKNNIFSFSFIKYAVSILTHLKFSLDQ